MGRYKVPTVEELAIQMTRMAGKRDALNLHISSSQQKEEEKKRKEIELRDQIAMGGLIRSHEALETPAEEIARLSQLILEYNNKMIKLREDNAKLRQAQINLDNRCRELTDKLELMTRKSREKAQALSMEELIRESGLEPARELLNLIKGSKDKTGEKISVDQQIKILIELLQYRMTKKKAPTTIEGDVDYNLTVTVKNYLTQEEANKGISDVLDKAGSMRSPGAVIDIPSEVSEHLTGEKMGGPDVKGPCE